MNVKILSVFLLLFCLDFTLQETNHLTQQQKEQIKKEVKATLDTIFAKGERLDADGALQYYSPELVVVGDTSLIDYQAYRKAWIDFNKATVSVKWTTVQWKCIVLTNDLVISAWVGKMEFLLKSGEKTTMYPQDYTDVFKKVGDQWKSIHEHYSGMPVTQQPSNK